MADIPKPHTDEDGYELSDYPRHPGQQHASGWSPRELARVVGAKVVSISPDVCLTPIGNSVVPIPYAISATLTDDAKACRSVKIEGKQTYNFKTIVTKCTGDQPGTKKGVKSGTRGDICEPKSHAPSIKIEGSHAIRNRETDAMKGINRTYSLQIAWKRAPLICQKFNCERSCFETRIPNGWRSAQ